MEQKRNIILIGKTGNGKSTLANVLVNDRIKHETFTESSGFGSETKEYKSVLFSYKEFEYTVIDTPGLSDTDIKNEKKVYEQIVRAVYSAENGLNQILFVTRDRFTKEEYDAYTLLKNAFFNEGAINFVTIIRTNFSYYDDPEKCIDDINKTISQTSQLAEVIKECECRVIHVDNPPVNVANPVEIKLNKAKREKSRNILLAYLSKCDKTYCHKAQPVSSETIIQLDDIKEELEEYKQIMNKHYKNIQNSLAAGSKKFCASTMLGSTLNVNLPTTSLDVCRSILARLSTKKKRDAAAKMNELKDKVDKYKGKGDLNELIKLCIKYEEAIQEEVKKLRITLEIKELQQNLTKK